MKVLCLNLEEEFVEYLALLKPEGVTLISYSSQNKMAHLPDEEIIGIITDESSEALLEEIQKPIVIIANKNYKSQKSHVLVKPILPVQIKELFRILESQSPATSHSELQINYIRKLNAKLDELRKNLSSLNSDQLRFEFHKIAGSAGTYGFPEISQLSKECELFIIQNEINSESFKYLIDKMEKISKLIAA